MTVKSNTAASWLAEVEKRVERLKSSTGEAAWNEAHELVAAAQILRDEIAIEANRTGI
jgi:hypothetical protein